MSPDIAIRQPPAQDSLRRSTPMGSGGEVVGSASVTDAPEIGPPNPRLRIDRDLGMVVIEFRDATGRLNASLPTNREIEAYRAFVVFGADLPPDVRALKVAGDGPSAARPGIPNLPREDASSKTSAPPIAGTSVGFDKLA